MPYSVYREHTVLEKMPYKYLSSRKTFCESVYVSDWAVYVWFSYSNAIEDRDRWMKTAINAGSLAERYTLTQMYTLVMYIERRDVERYYNTLDGLCNNMCRTQHNHMGYKLRTKPNSHAQHTISKMLSN